MNDYEQKQADRKARLEVAAGKARQRAGAAFDKARAITSAIPFGQPVLVGHHSERRHRRDLDKHDSAMRRGCEESDRAAELAGRAAAVGTGGISQDDPDAITKLEDELADLKATRAAELAANKAVKKLSNQWKAGEISTADIVARIDAPERIKKALARTAFAFPAFLPQFGPNTGASIRRVEKRIEELKAKASTPARETVVTDRYTIGDDVEANRTFIMFPARQPEPIVDELHARGFRWSHTESRWQRHRSNGAWHAARAIALLIDADKEQS